MRIRTRYEPMPRPPGEVTLVSVRVCRGELMAFRGSERFVWSSLASCWVRCP
jgi:hypothetical protein